LAERTDSHIVCFYERTDSHIVCFVERTDSHIVCFVEHMLFLDASSAHDRVTHLNMCTSRIKESNLYHNHIATCFIYVTSMYVRSMWQCFKGWWNIYMLWFITESTCINIWYNIEPITAYSM